MKESRGQPKSGTLNRLFKGSVKVAWISYLASRQQKIRDRNLISTSKFHTNVKAFIFNCSLFECKNRLVKSKNLSSDRKGQYWKTF